jgi:molybdopterin/thiamine biosynthesis adenylyltransferase
MKTTHLEEKRKTLIEKREKLLDRFSCAARTRRNTSRVCTEIRRTNEFLASLERIAAENTGGPSTGPRRYVVSSLFLHDCFKKLTADADEQFFFITGAEIGGAVVLDQSVEFAHQRRNRLSVVADMPSTHNLLIRLEQFGHKFLAHFHSHPGKGPDATRPSGTDDNFQKRLESAGHLAVMAIFSRDGFIRFIRIRTLKLKSTEKEWKTMHPAFTVSRTSIKLRGVAIPGAEDRQMKIRGFNQEVFSNSHVLCIGAGGIISQIAPTLVRKGIGGVTLLDDDLAEESNLNRQRFYTKDVGKNKAVALAENLLPECIAATEIHGIPFRLQEAIARELDLSCDVAICGVDNNPARIAASRYFRAKRTPVIFASVSLDGDHGYVFVQDRVGPCIACMFPDMINDERYPCPGTPAIVDILQSVGSLAVYAVDTLLMNRRRSWNYRRISLADGSFDGAALIPAREGCPMFAPGFSSHS